jgi:hypothetical protein
MSSTTFLTPPPVRGIPRLLRPAARADDVRVLADRVVGDAVHDVRWRAMAATRLAAAVLEDPASLTPAVARRLDERLPGLLGTADLAGTPDAGPLSALCAVLADHLSQEVCRPLQSLVRHAPTRVAVAAHVASLLVEGLTPSAQHLADLAAIADADPGPPYAARRRPLRTRAAVLACTLVASGDTIPDAGPPRAGYGEVERQRRTVRGRWR